MKKSILFSALMMAGAVQAATVEINDTNVSVHGSVIGDEVLYSIGGGRAVSMGPGVGLTHFGVGLDWNSNLICGNMSISTTLHNQLNGLTNGFQTIMSNVIENATSAVASLPAMLIQRAYPALYNLLTNGILQGRLDFDRSKLTCRAMANRMADTVGGYFGWDQVSESSKMKSAAASSNTDAVAAVEEAEANKGAAGVTWVGGQQSGGEGQPAIKIVADVTKAGYNLLNGRAALDVSSIPSATCAGRLTCSAWSSPALAAEWANKVLGEREQKTCETCTKTQTTPGMGLTTLIQEEYETKVGKLKDLVTGATAISPATLDEAGAGPLPVTRAVIEALREEPDQDMLGKRLASEVALASVMEKALLLQRTLMAGKKEPNVAANDLAVQAIDREIRDLEQEIGTLKTELELRRELAGNAAMAILQRRNLRAAASRGTFQGDTTRDRLREIERN